MSCSNCYNGCPQIVSDQCVKYTGIDIPVLGIKNGDSLSYVEQAIITFLTSTLDGTGIKLDIDPTIICNIVKKYLPTCGDLTVVDFIKALIQSVCEIKPLVDGNTTSITTINNFITSLESEYSIDCLEDVTSTSGTHAVLQAVIDKLCAFIIFEAPETYVKNTDLDVKIAAYLATLPGSSKYYTKMVPFVAVPFFPTPAIEAKFNGTGAGQDEWEKIYYCNGENGTPDLRGRVPVGATTGMVGAPLSPVVAPGGLNPDYQLGTNTGANGITLSEGQMPEHTHIADASTSTVTISPNPHSHGFVGNTNFTSGSGSAGGRVESAPPGSGSVIGGTVQDTTLTATPNIVVTNGLKGGNQAHSNVQPGIGSFYIMYIP